MKFFNASLNGSHVGVISYGTEAEVVMDFNTFQGDTFSPETVEQQINDMQPKGGHRFIDKALKMANERLFTSEAGMSIQSNDTLKVCCFIN